MKFKMTKNHWAVIITMMIISAAYRLMPQSTLNFAPISAMALLGTAYVKDSWKAWLLPVIAFWISDLALNNLLYSAYFDGFVWASQPFLFSAAAMLLIVIFGKYVLQKIRIRNLILGSLGASVIFFLVSNFGSWAQGMMYPKTFAGLMESYMMGLPFMDKTIIGDLVWTAILFGVWHLIFERTYSSQLAVEELSDK